MKPTPVDAEMMLPVGTNFQYNIHGDGSQTIVNVESLRYVTCVWLKQEFVGDKLVRTPVSTQTGSKCSFNKNENYDLDLTCLGTHPNTAVAGATFPVSCVDPVELNGGG